MNESIRHSAEHQIYMISPLFFIKLKTSQKINMQRIKYHFTYTIQIRFISTNFSRKSAVRNKSKKIKKKKISVRH